MLVATAACGGEPAVRVLLEADLSGLSDTERRKVMDGAFHVINSRLDRHGFSDRSIISQGSDRILVRVGGATDIKEIERLVSQTESTRTDTDCLVFKKRICKIDCTVFTDEHAGITGEHVLRAYAGHHPHGGHPIVTLELTPSGARIFGNLTSEMAGTHHRIAVFLNDEELVSPSVMTPIMSGSVIIQGGDFTDERVDTLARRLDFGVLPVPLTVVESGIK